MNLERFIVPGHPEESAIFQRMTHASMFRRRMPPIATQAIDTAGVELLKKWILSIRAGSRT